jgi:hypothetical protein
MAAICLRRRWYTSWVRFHKMRNLTWKVPSSIQGDTLVRVMCPPWYTRKNLQILYGDLKSNPNSQGGDEPKRQIVEETSLDPIAWVLYKILSMKECSCFVLYLWNPSNWDALDRVLGVFGKLCMVRGIGSMTFGLVVQKFLNIQWFLHWKLY